MSETLKNSIADASRKSFRDALLSDSGLSAQAGEQRYLLALVDLGIMSNESRIAAFRRLKDLETFLLLNDPKYEVLKLYGAMLVSCHQSDPDARLSLLDTVSECDTESVCAWLVSKLPPESLATHLGHASFAWDKSGKRYLLCYYDPLVTPVLYRLADREWARWFFAPLVSWWHPVLRKGEESWHRLEGEISVPLELARKHVGLEPPQLVLSKELWEALARDPLPHRLLEVMERTAPQVFEGERCYAKRLERIEGLLEEARRQGLTKRDDLALYVYAILRTADLAGDARWRSAVQSAAKGLCPLDTYFG
jgi:hypothetical protein